MPEENTTIPTEHDDTTDIIADFRERLLAGDGDALAEWIDDREPGDIVRAMAHLSAEEQLLILQMLDPEDAADLIDDLPDEHAADILGDISPSQAAAIVGEMDSDDRADVLGEMEDEDAEAILELMEKEEADEARQLLAYPSDTAGGIMVKEFVAFPTGTTVGEVLTDLRSNAEEYADYNVQYFYVIDRSGVLQGVLRMRDMVLSPSSRLIDQVMIRDPQVVRADEDLYTLQRLFEINIYSALPVVDAAGRLIGVVIEKEVAEAARKSASRVMLKLSGIFGGEELRSMSVWDRFRRRIIWLLVILVLSLAAASVIHFFEGTLKKMVYLALFLPVVAGMSGSSGNQAVGLSLRELALGVVKPWDLLYVIGKEMRVGILNGLAVGIALGVIGWLYQGPMLGLVLALAIAFNTVLSVCIGGTLPLLLKRAHLDPAMASSPIMTMTSDTLGFLFVLSLAELIIT